MEIFLIMKKKISVIIPCYKGSKTIISVIDKIPKFVKRIYVVDDKCPEKTGYLIKKKFKNNKKIKVILRDQNSGVGASMKDGYSMSLKEKMDISVKIDADGQMDPRLIKKFVIPIIDNDYDYTKGNRFHKFHNLFKMPFKRVVGNIFFSYLAKITTKNYNIFDVHNGYTAIKNTALKTIDYKDLDNSYFFETHILFKLKNKNKKIAQIKMQPIYQNEKSNLNDFKVGFQFLVKHYKLFIGSKIS